VRYGGVDRLVSLLNRVIISPITPQKFTKKFVNEINNYKKTGVKKNFL